MYTNRFFNRNIFNLVGKSHTNKNNTIQPDNNQRESMSQYFMSKSRDQEESRGGYSTRSRYLQQQPQQHHQQLPSSNYFQQNNNNYNNQSQSQLNQSEHESYHPSASSYDRHVPQDHSSVGGYGRNDGNLNSRAEYIQSTNYDYQNSSGSRDKYNDYDRNRNHDQGERNWRETPSNNNNHDRYDNSRFVYFFSLIFFYLLNN